MQSKVGNLSCVAIQTETAVHRCSLKSQTLLELCNQ